MQDNLLTVSANHEIEKWKKRDVSNRFADNETRTVIRILNESEGNEDQLCVLHPDIEELILQQKCQTELLFFQSNKAYLPTAAKKVAALAHFESMENAEQGIKRKAKLLSELITLSEQNGLPITCIKEGDAHMACLLAHFHVKAILMNKYWMDLPEGAILKDKCDQEFEELCSGLKIPRRTRAIMKRKAESRRASSISVVEEGGSND
jgi:hypothetical protein